MIGAYTDEKITTRMTRGNNDYLMVNKRMAKATPVFNPGTCQEQGGIKMAEQIGMVTRVDPGGWVSVLTDRKGACGGCHSGHGGGCHSCLAGAKFESRATNPVGARQGDIVKVSMPSGDFFKGAAMLYLLPVAALLVGALVGTWISGRFGWSATVGAISGAVAGIGLAVVFLILFDRSATVRSRLTPKVVEVLISAQSSSKPPISGHACCVE